MSNQPYCVVLDSNIWVAERLLQTSIGSAFLYAVTGSNGTIILPEIIQREVELRLLAMGEKAVDDIGRAARLLRQMSGHTLDYSAPTNDAIASGIADRWKQLAGRTERVAFSFEHAQAALERIYKAAPPCGLNNEQFRDCCLWEVAKREAHGKMVHLVTGDLAFYEARDHKRGLAAILRDEVQAEGIDVRLHATLGDFLGAVDAVSPKLNPDELRLALIPAIADAAWEKASNGRSDEQVELTLRSSPSINGYATPSSSAIAVTFEAQYLLKRVRAEAGQVVEKESTFTIEGTCSYDPNAKIASDVAVNSWSEFGQGRGGFSGWSNLGRIDRRQFEPGQQRRV